MSTPALSFTTDAYIIQIPKKRITAHLSLEEAFLKKMLNHIQNNLDNWDYAVSDLAQHMHLSPSQLTRRLSRLLQVPPGQIIFKIRMERAAELLLAKSATIGEIAFSVGYKDQGNFSRSFKRFYGCTPSRYGK